jgi:hypothetical protein
MSLGVLACESNGRWGGVDCAYCLFSFLPPLGPVQELQINSPMLTA